MTTKMLVCDDSGTYRDATAREILTAARTAATRLYKHGHYFTAPDAVKTFATAKLAGRDAECFSVIFLDNKHKMLSFREMFHGTIDGASVHPREVVKAALLENAAAVIFAHNHPSGVTDPSQADIRITQRLKDALALIEVRVLDHVIVGMDCYSMAEHGTI